MDSIKKGIENPPVKNQDSFVSDTELQDKHLAKRFGLEIVSTLDSYPLIRDRVKILPYSFVKKRRVIPIEKNDEVLTVAIAKPLDIELIQEIRHLTHLKIKEVFCNKELLDEAIEHTYHQSDDEAFQYIQNLQSREKSTLEEDEDVYDLLDKKSDSPVIRLLNVILVEACQQGASDIHFEPLEQGIEVRYRIDGVLQKRHSPPANLQQELLTRIKVMSKLDIAEHRMPQDGRIKLKMGGRPIDFRVSTVPVVYGERIVLRILDKSNVVLGLDKIGMETNCAKSFKKFIKQNQGIVLVTGPTGSGKTTTLYSAISEINSEDVNIMTIEDPVEYKLPQMAQIGVNTKIGLDFSKGLRHILRQDPDVIMIGEIRDKETAEIAIQASLTGHLVLSTLHTNDAPSALTRLVDMGIEPYLLSSAVLAVLAQRLIRQICPSCKVSYTPSDEELADLHLNRDDLQNNKLYRGSGCINCFQSGYKGRMGIYELMGVTREIKNQILSSPDATKLQQVAIELGLESLSKQAKKACIKGLSTSIEVLRVTRQIEI